MVMSEGTSYRPGTRCGSLAAMPGLGGRDLGGDGWSGGIENIELLQVLVGVWQQCLCMRKNREGGI